MIGLIRICVWFFWHRGWKAAVKRWRIGRMGLKTCVCEECGGWKGYTASTFCERCVFQPLENSLDEYLRKVGA